MKEQIKGPSNDPLGDAFNLFGHEIEVMKNSKNLQALTITMPKGNLMAGLYVTGVSGKLSSSLTLPDPDGGNNLAYASGDPWTVRWDWDETKGSHVNVEIGSGYYRLKYAFKAASRAGQGGLSSDIQYWNAIKQQTQATNWTPNYVDGNEGQRLVEWWSSRFHAARWGVYSDETPYQ